MVIHLFELQCACYVFTSSLASSLIRLLRIWIQLVLLCVVLPSWEQLQRYARKRMLQTFWQNWMVSSKKWANFGTMSFLWLFERFGRLLPKQYRLFALKILLIPREEWFLDKFSLFNSTIDYFSIEMHFLNKQNSWINSNCIFCSSCRDSSFLVFF